MKNTRDWNDSVSYRPRVVLNEHTAAVKALDWCPFNRNVLATGGGTSDGTIKIWNAASGALRTSTETGSQVSSLIWSKIHPEELYSGHGFSQNHIAVWNYPSMTIQQSLLSHEARILAMDMSPDSLSLASLSGDESIRLWDVYTSKGEGLRFAPSFGFPSIR